MTEGSFSLVPFPAPNIPNISITGNVSLRSNIIDLRYSLAGQLQDIFLPARSLHPGRKAELWKTTCLELFFALKGQPHYWEVNLSPSGDWNVYRMDAYRRIGFREETSIRRLPLEVQQEDGAFQLVALIDLNAVMESDQFLELGIAAVIQTRDGNESYWALNHPASAPDFHGRESLAMEMGAQTHLAQRSARGD